MSQLLLVGNPIKRRRKSAKRASPAQKRARAAFAARARARSGKRRTRHATVSNPIRRRRHSVARRRTRRNPIGGTSMRSIVPMLKSAGIGAVGAVGVEVVYGFAMPYMPAMLQSPVSDTGGINPAYYAAKGAVAIGLGIVGRKVLGAKAAQMVEGSLIVTMHDLAKQFIANSGMAVNLGGVNPAQVLPPLPVSQNLRAYVPGASRLMQPRGVSQSAGLSAYVSAASRETARR